ncbi:MAG: SAM-dependent methyltransferase, partial [Candidatus Margulisiibacteriota bacterium]
PLAEGSLSKHDQNVLTSFLREHPTKKDFCFNYTPGIDGFLKALSAYPSCDTVFLDLGYFSPGETPFIRPDCLAGQYGVTLFFPLYIPLLRFLAERHQLPVTVFEQPQETNFVAHLGSTSLQKMHAFSLPLQARFEDIKNAIGESDSLQAFHQRIRPLITQSAFSTSLLMLIAMQKANALGDWRFTLRWGHRLLKRYPTLSIKITWLMALAYYQKGALKKAAALLEQALENPSNFDPAWRLLSIIYLKLNFPEKELRSLRHLLPINRSEPTLTLLHQLFIVAGRIPLRRLYRRYANDIGNLVEHLSEAEKSRNPEITERALAAREASPLQIHYNRNPKLRVQKATSRVDSWVCHASNSVYTSLGHGNFIVERIPFRLTQCLMYAERIGRLIVAKAKMSPGRRIHVYEFGSGLGILSLHVLAYLKQYHHEVYKRFTLHLSDISKDSVALLQRIPTYRPFEGHVSFDVIDMTQVHYKKGESPDLIYFSYLADSLPTHHILYENGTLYEMLVETSVRDDAYYFDTDRFPPILKTGPQIARLARQNDIFSDPQVIWKLKQCIYESPFKLKLEKSKISAEDKRILRQFATQFKNQSLTPFVFNYCPIFLQTIKAASQLGTTVITVEYGSVEIDAIGYENRSTLITNYSAVIASGISFPVIEYYGEKMNFIVKKELIGYQNYAVCFTKEPAVAEVFGREFGPDRPLGEVPMSFKQQNLNPDDLDKLVSPTVLARLKSAVKWDSGPLTYLSSWAIKHNELPFAIRLIKKGLKDYPQLAPLYLSNLASAMLVMHPDKPDKAIQYYQKALKILPNFPGIHRVLKDLAVARSQYRQLIRLIKLHLTYGREDDTLSMVNSAAAAYYKLGNIRTCERLLRYVIACGEKVSSWSNTEKAAIENAKRLLVKIQAE